MRYYIHTLAIFAASSIANVSYSQWGDCGVSIEACTNPSFAVTPNNFGAKSFNLEQLQTRVQIQMQFLETADVYFLEN